MLNYEDIRCKLEYYEQKESVSTNSQLSWQQIRITPAESIPQTTVTYKSLYLKNGIVYHSHACRITTTRHLAGGGIADSTIANGNSEALPSCQNIG